VDGTGPMLGDGCHVGCGGVALMLAEVITRILLTVLHLIRREMEDKPNQSKIDSSGRCGDEALLQASNLSNKITPPPLPPPLTAPSSRNKDTARAPPYHDTIPCHLSDDTRSGNTPNSVGKENLYK